MIKKKKEFDKSALSQQNLKWHHEDIYAKVIISADRFGGNNFQQVKQLIFWLSKCKPQEVFEGLFKIFLLEDKYLQRQELAGNLLFQIKPKAKFNLLEKLFSCLETYNLSVEELPWYFVDIFGKEYVLNTLNIINNKNFLSNKAKRSLETIKWWVNNYNPS